MKKRFNRFNSFLILALIVVLFGHLITNSLQLREGSTFVGSVTKPTVVGKGPTFSTESPADRARFITPPSQPRATGYVTLQQPAQQRPAQQKTPTVPSNKPGPKPVYTTSKTSSGFNMRYNTPYAAANKNQKATSATSDPGYMGQTIGRR